MMNFINSGLDDLIVKSSKAKTYKQVYVPPGKGHKGYVKEVEVNVEESKSPKSNPKARVKPKYKKKPKPEQPDKQPEEQWNPFRNSAYQKAFKREFGHSITPTSSAKEYCEKQLKTPLLGIEVVNVDGNKVKITGFSEPHFTERFNLRFPEYIEQFVEGYTTEEFKKRGINIDSVDLSDENKREFDLHKNNMIQTDTKKLSNMLCDFIISAVKDPLFILKGNSLRTGGSTVYANRNAAVVVGNNGDIVTFWVQPIGKRFAIDKGWRGAPPPLSRFLRTYQADHPELNYDWDKILKHDNENPRFFLKEEFKEREE